MANQPPDRDGTWDRWLRRVTQIVALLVLVYVAVATTQDRPWLTTALVLLITGSPVAILLDAYLRRKGNGNH